MPEAGTPRLFEFQKRLRIYEFAQCSFVFISEWQRNLEGSVHRVFYRLAT